jgi:NO-binding membrane sensor protein with MHYT domain
MRVVGCITDGHNLWLVLVAGLICVLASHTTFSLLHRARLQQGREAALWLAAAALALGSGVWATHFIAMLAYETPVPVGYDMPLTALSAAIAIAVSGVGLAAEQILIALEAGRQPAQPQVRRYWPGPGAVASSGRRSPRQSAH